MTRKRASTATPDRSAGLSAEAARLLTTAAERLQQRDAEAAEPMLRGVLALAPHHPEALRLWSIACILRNDADGAIAALRRALAARPDDALLHNNLGNALRAAGDLDGAVAEFRRAVELAPTLAAAWYNLGKTLKTQARSASADEALTRALALAPEHVAARIVYADNLKALGRVADAVAAYRHALEREPHAALAWWGLANLKTVRFDADDLDRLQGGFASSTRTGDRALLGFALVKALEDHRRYDEAWRVLEQANALRRAEVPWNAAMFNRYVDDILAAFQAPLPQEPAPLGGEVIFIVSLPRSGSTLVEQILAAHPQIEGAGELPDLPAVIARESQRRGLPFPVWAAQADAADWRRLGEEYLERTKSWRDRRAIHTDKGLDNWLYLGTAAAMLPAARFVHSRRDALETALSCYRQWFNAGQAFSYSRDDIADYFGSHVKAMRHWRSHHRERVHEQSLEALQVDLEAEVRRLLAFLHLDFDARCLAFHDHDRPVRTASAAQVRVALQRDTRRVPDYETWLGEWRKKLLPHASR